jgi:hypothetical protein
MSDRLKQFIDDHRDEFDGEGPSRKLWERVEEEISPKQTEGKRTPKIGFIRWGIAAAVLILLTGGFWYFLSGPHKSTGDSPLANKPSDSSLNKKENAPLVAVKPDSISKEKLAVATKQTKEIQDKQVLNSDPQQDMKEEMVHYAKLIEIKQRELKTIQRDEPLLYKQFSGDLTKLDSVYHSLENQLPTNHNSEELLEAMIQNLQLQMGLLNQQLGIIKKINHKKKSVYEKAYQSI